MRNSDTNGPGERRSSERSRATGRRAVQIAEPLVDHVNVRVPQIAVTAPQRGGVPGGVLLAWQSMQMLRALIRRL